MTVSHFIPSEIRVDTMTFAGMKLPLEDPH